MKMRIPEIFEIVYNFEPNSFQKQYQKAIEIDKI